MQDTTSCHKLQKEIFRPSQVAVAEFADLVHSQKLNNINTEDKRKFCKRKKSHQTR